MRLLFIPSLLLFVCPAWAQDEVPELPFWAVRELRHWTGLPMQGGPNGECIAGYTETESEVRFFADGSFQEIVFEHRPIVLYYIPYGSHLELCTTLDGDTLALINGRWQHDGDTLRVVVTDAGLHPYDGFVEELFVHDGERPFVPSKPAVRACYALSERSFVIGEDRVDEGGRMWQ